MPNQYSKCNQENVIQQLVKVQAQVTVTPLIEHGNPNVYCLNSCIKPNPNGCYQEDYNCYNCQSSCNCGCNKDCNCYDWNANNNANLECNKKNHKYNYTLTQVICVEIPLSIDADVDIKEGIVCCDTPNIIPAENIKRRNRFHMQLI